MISGIGMHCNTTEAEKGCKYQRKQQYMAECKQPTELQLPDSFVNLKYKKTSSRLVVLFTELQTQ